MGKRKHRPWKGRKVIIIEPNSFHFGEQGIITKADSETACVKFDSEFESWYYYGEFEPVDGNE